MKAYLINLKGKKVSNVITTKEGVDTLREKVIVKGKRKHSMVLVITE